MSSTDDLVDVMNATMSQHFARVKDVPITIPARKLALAVEAHLTGGRAVPAIPIYVAELAEKLKWTGLTPDPGTYVPGSIAAKLDEDGTIKVTVIPDEDLTLERPVTAPDPSPIHIELLTTDLRGLALHLLSVVEAAEATE